MKQHVRVKTKNVKIWVTRVIVAALLVMMIVPILPIPAKAAVDVVGETAGILEKVQGTGKAPTGNAYILETSTGQQPGDSISFFLIRYKVKGESTVRKQYILPNQDSLGVGRKEVEAICGSEAKIESTVTDKMGYAAMEAWNEEKGLKSYKTDQYYFTTREPMAEVLSVDAYMKEADTWTCLAVRLFSVEELYGVKMAGAWSAEWYIDFKGKLLLEMVDNGSISWSKISACMLYMDSLASWRTNFDGKDYAQHVTQQTKTYGFRVDFADVYKGGFESCYANYNDGQKTAIDLNMAEVMTMNVIYDDIYGVPRTIHIPVITNAVLWLNDRGFCKAGNEILGVALQGEQLAFTGEIPDFKSLRDISLTIGSDKAKAEAGIWSKTQNNRRSQREATSNAGDNAYILSFAMYNMETAKFSPKKEGALLKYDFEGKPIKFMKSRNSDGYELAVGSVTSLGMKDYDGTDLDDKIVWKDAYLVKMNTDTVASASTYGDLKIRFNYTTKSGLPLQTEEYDVRNLVNNYYGYWPGTVTSHAGKYDEDFAYRYGITKGNTLTFFISASNVSSFTGATLSLGTDADEYQVSDVYFYSIKCIGERKADWKDLEAEGNKTHVYFYRVYSEGGVEKELSESETAVLIGQNHDKTLVLPGQTKKWDFVTNTVETIEEDAFDPEEYAINYERAMQNFGFTKDRMRYEVTVHVANDKSYSENGSNLKSNVYEDTDSGSENLFYFQLVFEKGASAFVLANQQLDGDRFQSGTDPSFTILTNQDYGEIQSIRIIPDDISEDNKKYDKLQVEYLSVTEGTVQGTHREWQCRDVGWVGIDYTDEATVQSLGGKEGRTLGSIARTYAVDYVTNCVDIEFSLVTNRGDKSEDRNPDTGKMTRNYVDQMRGKVSGKIYYTDNAGSAQEKEFDVVERMYAYMNRKSVGSNPVSDPDYMFRESHTDRFVVALSDVSVIKAIDFYVTASDYNYKWNIGGISAKIVKEPGTLRINKFDEYEYDYPGEEDPEDEIILKASSDTNPIVSTILTSTMQTVHIPVTCNPIKIEVEQGKAAVTYTRMPLTGNDKVNVYVFPRIGKTSDDISQYDLECEVTYVHPAGMYHNKTNEDNPMLKYLGDEVNRPMFYMLGLSTKNMLDLNKLWIKANSYYANSCCIDFAIVQQIRKDTVVATYYIDYDGIEVSTDGVTGFPTEKKNFLGYSEEQVAYVQFGAGTATSGLYPERQDIGISIAYKSSFDPNGPTYESPTVFLTDEDYNRVKDGQVVELHFAQDFIGEIESVKAVSNGGVVATIDKAAVATYHKDTGGYREVVGWYSFGTPVTLDDGKRTMQRTASELHADNTIMPVTFTFKTSAASDAFESGTRDPVKASIYVTDWEEKVRTPIEVPDLRKYIDGTDTNFLTGKTQTVKMLLTGCAGVRRIVIEPSNGNGTAGWSLDTVSVKVAGGDPVEKAMKDKRIYEGSPRSILFSNVTLSTQVQYYNVTKSAFDSVTAVNEEISVVSPVDQPIYFTPDVIGSEYGYTIKINEISASGAVADDVTDHCKQTGGREKFDPPKNETGKTKYYKAVITSKEAPEATVTVTISIDPTLKENKAVEDAAELAVREKFEEYQEKLLKEFDTDDSTYAYKNWERYDELLSGAESDIRTKRYTSTKKLEDQLDELDKIKSKLMDNLRKQAEEDFYEAKKEVEETLNSYQEDIDSHESTHVTCKLVMQNSLDKAKAKIADITYDTAEGNTVQEKIDYVYDIQRNCAYEAFNDSGDTDPLWKTVEKLFDGDYATYQATEKQKAINDVQNYLKSNKECGTCDSLRAEALEKLNALTTLDYDVAKTPQANKDAADERLKAIVDPFKKEIYDHQIMDWPHNENAQH